MFSKGAVEDDVIGEDDKGALEGVLKDNGSVFGGLDAVDFDIKNNVFGGRADPVEALLDALVFEYFERSFLRAISFLQEAHNLLYSLQ